MGIITSARRSQRVLVAVGATVGIALALFVPRYGAVATYSSTNTASIAGKISVGHHAVKGFCAFALGDGESLTAGTARANHRSGRYVIRDLLPGDYSVFFGPCTSRTRLGRKVAAQTFDGDPGVPFVGGDYGDLVSVSDGQRTDGIDGSLSRGGRIVGVVTHNGHRVRDAIVQFDLENAPGATGTVLGSDFFSSTNRRGAFSSLALPIGETYSVTVSGGSLAGSFTVSGVAVNSARHATSVHIDVP